MATSLVRPGRGLAAGCMALFLTWTSHSFAQTDDERAGARAAATQGANAFVERRWSDAIDLFSRAESLVHSPVHLLYMARAHAQLKKYVRARELYIKVVNEPIPADAPPAFRDARSEAEAELAQIEPKVPSVSVVVQGGGAKQVTVTMDGIQVPPALLGVPRPVDPGDHKFQAFADGMESAVSSIAVGEGRNETVVLTLQPTTNPPPAVVAAPVDGAPEPVGPPAGPPPDPATPPAPAPVEADQGGGGVNGLKVGGFIALGVGAVGLGVGTVFALNASSKVDDADEICSGPQGCPESRRGQVEELDDDARSANTVSLVGFIVGGVGVATGVTLLILGGSGSAEQASNAPSLSAWAGPACAGLKGRF